jgi:NitT/TauT family transport system ATP-binding protein
MSAPALVVENVSKIFNAGDGPVHAIEDLSFEVRAGEFFSVIGPSGCGKTTLFNIIGGLIDGYDGRVLVDSAPVRGSHGSIGMVFQEESTFPWRTTLENIAFPLEVAGTPKPERLARARELVKLVGLEGFENRYPAQLSGGMRQRTAMARTLAFSPRILLMDEPFAALDEQTRLLLGDKVLQIQQKLRQTTLLITHNIAEAVQLSDRVLIMSYRPGRLKRIIEIDLPRPRTSEIIGSPQFGQYVAALWADLREEASKGLRADEAARDGT